MESAEPIPHPTTRKTRRYFHFAESAVARPLPTRPGETPKKKPGNPLTTSGRLRITDPHETIFTTALPTSHPSVKINSTETHPRKCNLPGSPAARIRP